MIFLKRVEAPKPTALFVAEVKAHCNVDFEDDDPVLLSMMAAASAELDGPRGQLGRALLTQTWDMKLRDFTTCQEPMTEDQYYLRDHGHPYAAGIRVPLPPLQSVTFIKYFDTQGVEQTLDPSKYIVSGIGGSDRANICIAQGQSWPSLYAREEAVTVRFVCGYGDQNDVPPEIREAVGRVVAHRYQNRETMIIGTSWSELPDVDRLLSGFRLMYSL